MTIFGESDVAVTGFDLAARAADVGCEVATVEPEPSNPAATAEPVVTTAPTEPSNPAVTAMESGTANQGTNNGANPTCTAKPTATASTKNDFLPQILARTGVNAMWFGIVIAVLLGAGIGAVGVSRRRHK